MLVWRASSVIQFFEQAMKAGDAAGSVMAAESNGEQLCTHLYKSFACRSAFGLLSLLFPR
jgi:hypothetical protein